MKAKYFESLDVEKETNLHGAPKVYYACQKDDKHHFQTFPYVPKDAEDGEAAKRENTG